MRLPPQLLLPASPGLQNTAALLVRRQKQFLSRPGRRVSCQSQHLMGYNTQQDCLSDNSSGLSDASLASCGRSMGGHHFSCQSQGLVGYAAQHGTQHSTQQRVSDNSSSLSDLSCQSQHLTGYATQHSTQHRMPDLSCHCQRPRAAPHSATHSIAHRTTATICQTPAWLLPLNRSMEV